MKFKPLLAGLVIAAASSVSWAAPVISEGFDNVADLAGKGWIRSNQSTPGGSTDWYQGDGSLFPAQAGAASSYIAANYNNAPVGGTVANWLVTPAFSTEQCSIVSFWARADIIDGFFDTLSFGFIDSRGNLDPAQLTQTETLGGEWTHYTVTLGGMGAGTSARFAFLYTGAADSSNYIGIDTVTVNLPEPGTLALLALTLTGLAVGRRRRAAAI